MQTGHRRMLLLRFDEKRQLAVTVCVCVCVSVQEVKDSGK